MNANSHQYANHPAPKPFRLDDLTVFPDRCVVCGPHDERRVEPRVMALLMRLVQQPMEVVTRDELLDSVWNGLVVCDHVVTRSISQLRKVLGGSNCIQTIPKKGYRLTRLPQPLTPAPEPDLLLTTLLQKGLKTVAVLPLQQLGSSPDASRLGIGFARDLTQLLALHPELRVVASSSLEPCWQATQDPIAVAERFNADYAVSGAIESHQDTFRLRLELVDTNTHQLLWADRMDAQIDNFFVVQDKLGQRIARSLCSALEIDQVQQIEGQIEARREFNPNAYERIQLAEDARRNYSCQAATFIIENLTAAIAQQPDHGIAHAFLAMQYSQNLVSGWCSDAQDTRRKARAHLEQAHRLAPNDPRVLMAIGIAALMRGEHDVALEYLEQSLSKNPNEAHALAEYGTARFYVTRELAPSLALIEQAEQAAPQHPRFSIWAYRRGICFYETGALTAAVSAFDEAIRRTPSYHHTYLTKALALITMGDLVAARQAITQALQHAPETQCADYLAGVELFGLSVDSNQRETLHRLWIS